MATDKAGKLNDDRAYTIALLGWQLAQLRREHITNRKRPKTASSIVESMPIRQATRFKMI